jgi:hypothetical protein
MMMNGTNQTELWRMLKNEDGNVDEGNQKKYDKAVKAAFGE